MEHSGHALLLLQRHRRKQAQPGSIRIRVETIGYFLERRREDMVRNKQKASTIEQQLREFEARLRRQMLREKLGANDLVRESFETGSMPQIHVSIGALQASRPAAPEYEPVQGD